MLRKKGRGWYSLRLLVRRLVGADEDSLCGVNIMTVAL